jgi:hypothetical protein
MLFSICSIFMNGIMTNTIGIGMFACPFELECAVENINGISNNVYAPLSYKQL